MADTEPPGGGSAPDPAGPAGPEPAEKPDWWSSTEQSPLAKLGTTAARPSAVASGPSASAAGDSGVRPASTRTARVDGSGIGWSLALAAGAGAMIAGSLSAWLDIKGLFGSGDVTGVSEGSLGWVSLIAAIVVGVAAVAIAARGTEAAPRRFFSLVAGAGAGAAFATSVYALVQQPSSHGMSLGWGLILVLVGSIFALIVSLAINVSDT